jgi:hypothetical protein
MSDVYAKNRTSATDAEKIVPHAEKAAYLMRPISR